MVTLRWGSILARDRPDEAVVAHAGEALEQRRAFERLTRDEQDAVLKFLESLQVLPPGTKHLVVDERYQPKRWPPSTR